MGKKFDGQSVMLIVNLVLILILSYYSIPSMHQLPQTLEPHVTASLDHEGAEHGQADANEHAVLEEKAPAHEEISVEVAETPEVAEISVEVEETSAPEEKAAVEELPESEETPAAVEEPPALQETPAAVEESAETQEPPAVENEQPLGMPDVITMDNSIYESHRKGLVQFTHKKHIADYGVSCGDCHHGDDGEPLADLKEEDGVTGCAECHNEPGTAPKSKDKKLSESEKLAFHAEALHANCMGCHKAYNKKNNTKAAPASCVKCHPKK